MDQPSEEPEARVLVTGAPVDDGDTLFVGSLAEAIEFVRALPAEQRAELAVVTAGRVYDPREL